MAPNSSASIHQRAAEVQALLFVEGGPVTLRKLASLLHVSPAELSDALDELERMLADSGVALIRTHTEATLATTPSVEEAVQKAREESLGREIGDAGLEVLAIVLYRGPSTRAQIDYIRGVNSSSTIRTLLSRALLERVGNPEDAREYLYRPTTELMAHLGAAKLADLPDHAAITAELAAFEKSQSQEHPAPPEDHVEQN